MLLLYGSLLDNGSLNVTTSETTLTGVVSFSAPVVTTTRSTSVPFYWYADAWTCYADGEEDPGYWGAELDQVGVLSTVQSFVSPTVSASRDVTVLSDTLSSVQSLVSPVVSTSRNITVSTPTLSVTQSLLSSSVTSVRNVSVSSSTYSANQTLIDSIASTERSVSVESFTLDSSQVLLDSSVSTTRNASVSSATLVSDQEFIPGIASSGTTVSISTFDFIANTSFVPGAVSADANVANTLLTVLSEFTPSSVNVEATVGSFLLVGVASFSPGSTSSFANATSLDVSLVSSLLPGTVTIVIDVNVTTPILGSSLSFVSPQYVADAFASSADFTLSTVFLGPTVDILSGNEVEIVLDDVFTDVSGRNQSDCGIVTRLEPIRAELGCSGYRGKISPSQPKILFGTKSNEVRQLDSEYYVDNYKDRYKVIPTLPGSVNLNVGRVKKSD